MDRPTDRPTVANRSIDRLKKITEKVVELCSSSFDDKSFSFVKHYSISFLFPLCVLKLQVPYPRAPMCFPADMPVTERIDMIQHYLEQLQYPFFVTNFANMLLWMALFLPVCNVQRQLKLHMCLCNLSCLLICQVFLINVDLIMILVDD